MSGGSFDYLYTKEPWELFNEISELQDMREHLIRYGYEDIAKDTQRLIEYIESARVTIGTLSEILLDVFHAVEWYTSGDYGHETLIKILEEYRKKKFDERANIERELALKAPKPQK